MIGPLDPIASSRALEQTLQHDAVHARWNRDFHTSANCAFFERAFDHIATILGAPEGTVILDAGCGNCDHSVRLARRGFHVVACDYSESVIQAAERILHSTDVHQMVRVERQNLLSLTFGGETFDHVLCWGVLMHIPEVGRAVAELARVVRGGGYVIISEANMHSFESVARRVYRRFRRRDNVEDRRTGPGLEHWAETESGILLTREADIGWLTRELRGMGLVLVHRMAGQFTEAYLKLGSRVLQRPIHALNRLWFSGRGWAWPAYGNLLFYRKLERQYG